MCSALQSDSTWFHFHTADRDVISKESKSDVSSQKVRAASIEAARIRGTVGKTQSDCESGLFVVQEVSLASLAHVVCSLVILYLAVADIALAVMT